METFSGRGNRQPAPHREPAVHHQPEPVAAAEPTALTRPYSARGHSEDRAKKGWFVKAVVIVVALAVLAAGLWGYNALSQGTLIDSGKYQAVFLTNGQVYFGKLSRVNGETYKLVKILVQD